MPETLHDAYIQVPPIGEPNGDLIDMPWHYIVRMIDRTPVERTDPIGDILDIEHYNAPRDEPHEENAEYYWQWMMWITNWFLPTMPIASNATQHFLNTENWLWPRVLTDWGKDVETKWEYFGEAAHLHDYLGEGLIQANLSNPKHEAEIVDREVRTPTGAGTDCSYFG